jgi:hypothetical protein
MVDARLEEMEDISWIHERLQDVEKEMAALRRCLGSIASFDDLTNVDVYTFPEGEKPVRQTAGAIGFDSFSRAIVDPRSKPTAEDPLRRTMADFQLVDDWESRIDPSIRGWVVDEEPDKKTYGISLPPGERLMVGLGFATRMQYPMYYWVTPRSGFAAKGITVSTARSKPVAPKHGLM